VTKKKTQKSAEVTLVNESRQRQDVLLATSKGLKPLSVCKNKSVKIKKCEISEQLQSMLDNPGNFGLRIEETAVKPSKAEEDDE